MKTLLKFWPEVAIAVCWLWLFFVSDLVDDESIIHRTAHLGLWLSLGGYVVVTVRQHRAVRP